MPRALKAIKQPVAQRIIGHWRFVNAPVLSKLVCKDARVRFWQAGGGFDRNVRDREELFREVHYIHNNPVKRGLVSSATEWKWSSARWYAGEREGQIPIDPLMRWEPRENHAAGSTEQ